MLKWALVVKIRYSRYMCQLRCFPDMFTLLRTVHKNPAKLIVFILKNEGPAQLYIIFLVLESMNTLKVD